MSLLVKYRQVFHKIIGIIFLLLLTYSEPITISCAEADGSGKVKKIGIEKFEIQGRSNNSNARSIDVSAGAIVADIFYEELSSYNYYDLIAPAEMPFSIELSKTPETPVGMPLIQTKKSQPYKEKKDLKDIPEANLIDLDAIVARAISKYGNTDLDAVVTGVVTRYDDRDGSAIAANKPASVAFIVYLISLNDKRIVWSEHFAETQISLFENVFLLERFRQAGGMWLSSGDLTQLVMRRAIKTFPGVNQDNVKLISK